MSLHQMKNSRSADLFTDLSLASVSASTEASSSPTVVSFTAPTSSATASSLPAANVPDPAFLATVVSAVKVALAAEKSSVSRGVPAQQMDLGAHAASFISSVLVFLRPNQPRLLQRPKVGIILLCLPLFLPLWNRTLPIQAQSFLLVSRAWL